MEINSVSHLVKSEDLNHHGTLYAGRMSEWFVEACFINGAQNTQHPENIVCVKIHELSFYTPTNKGDILNIKTQMIKAGRTSFVVYGEAYKNNDETKIVADSYITFVFVDDQGRPIEHNLIVDQSEIANQIINRFKNL